MISSRGQRWNLPFITKYISNIVLGFVILCYLVYSDFKLDVCLPALRIYSLCVIIEEFLIYCILRRAAATDSKAKTKTKSSKVADAFFIVLLSVCCVFGIHILAILFGAYVIENFEETLTFSFVVASLALIRPLIALGPRAIQILLERLNWEEEPDLQCIVIFIGAWLGALPIPLDWDRPWQIWPLTCCIGAIFGELSTSGYLLTKLSISESNRRKNKAT